MAAPQSATPLTTRVETGATLLVPQLLVKCISMIEKIGMTEEGLYRIPGNSATVSQLYASFIADPASIRLRPPPVYSQFIHASAVDQVADPRRFSLARRDSAVRRRSMEEGVSLRESVESIRTSIASLSSAFANSCYDNDVHVLAGMSRCLYQVLSRCG